MALRVRASPARMVVTVRPAWRPGRSSCRSDAARDRIRARGGCLRWAADHGADVLSCSWGPVDGNWRNDNDPTHQQVSPIPDHTRLAIDYAASQGRGGKGCLIFFAAGNGNGNVDRDG